MCALRIALTFPVPHQTSNQASWPWFVTMFFNKFPRYFISSVHWIAAVHLGLKSLQFSHPLSFDLGTHWHVSKDYFKSHKCIGCRRWLSSISCHKMTWQNQGNLWGTDLKVVCCSLWKLYPCVDRAIPALPVQHPWKFCSWIPLRWYTQARDFGQTLLPGCDSWKPHFLQPYMQNQASA